MTGARPLDVRAWKAGPQWTVSVANLGTARARRRDDVPAVARAIMRRTTGSEHPFAITFEGDGSEARPALGGVVTHWAVRAPTRRSEPSELRRSPPPGSGDDVV